MKLLRTLSDNRDRKNPSPNSVGAGITVRQFWMAEGQEVPQISSQIADDKNLEQVTKKEKQKNKRKKSLIKEAEKADRRGVCYLSRVPPHMDPLKLQQIISQYGEIQRLYLTPEDPSAQVHRKKSGEFRRQEFSEGWVEFTEKRVAKRVSNMLNGEQVVGKGHPSIMTFGTSNT